jgi:hypothetical protein
MSRRKSRIRVFIKKKKISKGKEELLAHFL